MKQIWILVIILIILVIAGRLATSDEGIAIIKSGEYAPDFTLVNTLGEEVTLKDHRNRVVLINFWATWCPPCMQEMPDIQSRYEIHKDNLSVLAVNNGDSLAQVTSFRDEVGLTFEPLLDTNSSVTGLYQVYSFPTSIFLDEHGIIRFIHIGLMTASQLDAYLVDLGLNSE